MTSGSNRPGAGFWIVAGLLTLWEATGCAYYLGDVGKGGAGHPVNTALFALSVWTGLAGAILLLLRRRVAGLALLVSLVAFTAMIVGIFASGRGLDDSVLTAATFVVGVFSVWYARHAATRGWLR